VAAARGAAAWLLVLAASAAAQSTRSWEQTRFDEFEKGVAEGICLRSDGKLALAPRFQQIYDAPTAYLWALARDSRGNLYAGGGPGGRVFKIAPDGGRTVALETEALEIHALAVDEKDNVYAATSPDSKIYRIEPSGGSSLLVDPKVKYVWAMAFNRRGELFLATGDKGEIYRVDRSGRASVFFKSEESHIRSLGIDRNDDLIAGTDPGGLILRIPASGGPGFVLHQSTKKEIAALAIAVDGSIYAAGVGTRSRAIAPPPPPAAPAPTSAGPAPVTLGIPASAQTAPAPQPVPLASALRPGPSGGSEIIRISRDGEPRKLWSSNDDLVYALGFNPAGKLLVGTGNQGKILQLESDHIYSLLIKGAPAQITAFLGQAGGGVWVATGNVGKIYQLGPELERKGIFESEVFDTGNFSRWGRLSWKAAIAKGTGLTLYTRSGNLSSPGEYWSSWTRAAGDSDGERSAVPAGSPPARFIQWKAVLEAGGADSPLLDSVSLAYQPKNVAPTISEMELTPPNHRFPDPLPISASSSKPLSLAPLGTRPAGRQVTASPLTPSMIPAKGYLGARWLVQDDNQDDLIFKAEIRGRREQTWKLLRDEIPEPHLSWDSTAFADGVYQLRVTVSDSPSNAGAEALSFSKESEPFHIDNTAPVISPPAAAAEAGRLRVRFRVSDALTPIQQSEYSVDGGDWLPMLPATRLLDATELDFDFLTAPVPPGEHTVAIRVWDASDNLAAAKAVVVSQ